ncbi:MAG: YggS family pyridoxal phosphate-dependent enzyme [Saprospiraceae bacterium]|uniref:Pyridoxal phosphate homeostasis protein n=1 Tax=Candidatus Defluviibacterium haderslevense TaxID=2981993 RepID=A0A9D7S858_9BACT|nr:YggS family pyridoxal phosphate-dependent enzyme [Candidatus Defluviibacterium haderslevense]MBL0237466.1 YggS family pyridoxal phosphate-dependent enzyme [Candidatus Defluviibacterium haderslevense]
MNSYLKILEKTQAAHVNLIVVSKFQTVENIKKIYDQGQRDFGENRIQELLIKKDQLPKDIRWHVIGHLQKNKVQDIVPFVFLIQSVDSLALAQQISKEASKLNKSIDILIQIKLSQEESKFGLDYKQLITELDLHLWQELPHIRIKGIMGMGSLTENQSITRQEFKTLKQYFNILKASYLLDPEFTEISMGMSGDFQLAIEEGSTMVRIGSLIFT